MTGQACITFISIVIDIAMLVVHFGLVMFMAHYTAKNGVVIRSGMTIRAVLPFSFMLAAINREEMLKGGWSPGRLRMA